MTFDTAAYSARGPRDANEDAYAFDVDDARGRGAWFLADGLGGHAGGDIASRTAVDAAIAYIRCGAPDALDPDARSALGAVDAADRALRARISAHPALADMRTTFVAAIARNDELRIAHLGDSRLYLLRDGGIAYRTRDHSLAELDVRLGEIGEDGIRGHPDRNVVLRMLPIGSRAWCKGQPTIRALLPGDAFALCTDGFWECLYDDEMARDLSASGDARDWLRRMVERVRGRAPRDNHSAICCRVCCDCGGGA